MSKSIIRLRAKLVALYEATDGANWTSNDNWLSNRPIGEWYGVTTDRGGRVTELSLDFSQLSGEIPGELGSLVNLKGLWLRDNQLMRPYSLGVSWPRWRTLRRPTSHFIAV